MLLRLPLDVIHHVIYDMLDCESRVCLNRLLPPHERHARKLGVVTCIDHQIKVSCLMLRSVFDRFCASPAFSHSRIQCLCDALSRAATPPHTTIMLHHPSFRASILNKAEMVMREHGTWGHGGRLRRKMRRVAKRVIRFCAALEEKERERRTTL